MACASSLAWGGLLWLVGVLVLVLFAVLVLDHILTCVSASGRLSRGRRRRRRRRAPRALRPRRRTSARHLRRQRRSLHRCRRCRLQRRRRCRSHRCPSVQRPWVPAFPLRERWAGVAAVGTRNRFGEGTRVDTWTKDAALGGWSVRSGRARRAPAGYGLVRLRRHLRVSHRHFPRSWSSRCRSSPQSRNRHWRARSRSPRGQTPQNRQGGTRPR